MVFHGVPDLLRMILENPTGLARSGTYIFKQR
jgi:hypothetical protein